MLFIQSKIRSAQKRLSSYSRLLSEKGLTYSCFGNISLRIGDIILIKKHAVNLELALPADFCPLHIKDNPDSMKNTQYSSSEWKMHVYVYNKNPRYRVLFHLHPFYISLLDDLKLNLDTDDLEFKYILKGKIGILPQIAPGSDELAESVALNILKHPFLILRKHGIVVAAEDLKTAYDYSITAETIAKRIINLSLYKKYL